MPLFNEGVMQYLNSGLDAASLRQEVTANNLANMNTPGFKSSHVSFEDELQKARGDDGKVQLRQTHPQHQPQKPHEIEPRVETNESTTRRIDGNNVDLEKEMINLVENQLRYNTMTQQTRDRFDTWRYVINEGR